MTSWHRRMITWLAASAVAVSHVGAAANTRAADGGPIVLPASVAQVGAFPYSSWLVPEEDDAAALWPWLLGGTIGFLLISTVISNDPSGKNSGPNNGSNGAN